MSVYESSSARYKECIVHVHIEKKSIEINRVLLCKKQKNIHCASKGASLFCEMFVYAKECIILTFQENIFEKVFMINAKEDRTKKKH